MRNDGKETPPPGRKDMSVHEAQRGEQPLHEKEAPPGRKDASSPLEFDFDAAPVYSLAAQQNAYPLFRNLRLRCAAAGEVAESLPPLRDLALRLTCEQDLAQAEEWRLDEISPGQCLALPERSVMLPHDYLFRLSDETRLRFTFTLSAASADVPLLAREQEVHVLPANFWGGEQRQPDLLAAFVKPNGVYVESLVRLAAEIMEKHGHARSADGYQSNTRERPYLMANALWRAIFSQELAYAEPPPSFAHLGQRVRLAQEISTARLAACLDLSLLFAGCLELMGLNTVIALTRGHAMAGVWLYDTSFPWLVNDDPLELRKRVDARDLLLFETTLVAGPRFVEFEQARAAARAHLDEDKEGDFVYALDVKCARNRQVKPLASEEERRPEAPSAERAAAPPLPPPPSLPPVEPDNRSEEATPATRIESWQGKLLDMSKRNPLLNLRRNAAAVRLYCHDIGRLEDLLASGRTFSFKPAADSPGAAAERSQQAFRLQTGDDLHRKFAAEELEDGRLIADMPPQKLASATTSLYRKAKNDLEEGGANTLYLALGFLRWKEFPEDDRDYLAPLVLLPAQLVRKSARSGIKLRQLPEESPLFNLTLIEFLRQRFEINLDEFREALPEDDQGVDVHEIWYQVRRRIEDERGFEVVEDCLVASFSFAKYIMWKDLAERCEELKKNPFVEHLVERPGAPYPKTPLFIDGGQVDERIAPDQVFIPLNCDSSQLVAVEASGHPQDFVLEGPPGTGKSETIANIICHNLALGRKVLFVAEKIAALEVVYRRIKKVGLDHLALELHSNKANKKAVLDQLRRSLAKHGEFNETRWLEQARDLKRRRDRLNAYVAALHRPSPFGISARGAIARVSWGRRAGHPDSARWLGWGHDIHSCPVADAAGLNRLKETTRRLAAAFYDVKDLDAAPFRCVTAVAWSNAWQEEVLELLEEYRRAAPGCFAALGDFAGELHIPARDYALDDARRLEQGGRLLDLAQAASCGYAIRPGAAERLQRLAELAALQEALDACLAEIGRGATAEKLLRSPMDDWRRLRAGADNWFKRLWGKRRLNRQAVKLGYQPFPGVEAVELLSRGQELALKLQQLAPEFEEDRVWQGWDTPVDRIKERLAAGNEAHEAVKGLVSMADNPAALVERLVQQAVDGRDYLASSQLGARRQAFKEQYGRLADILQQLAGKGVRVAPGKPHDALLADLEAVLRQRNRLKAWVEWRSARGRALELQLDAVATALESGQLRPDDAEEHFITAFCAWLAPRLIDGDERLVKFKATEHQRLVEEFRRLDAQVAQSTSGFVAAKLAGSAPDMEAPELAFLRRELQKKSRHRPIRTLFAETGARLLDLCPCMMMSPLSVAQFLSPDFKGFDLVVFDEASQITPWDSVGAVARGRQVIVVGDPKQLPPTSFFNAAVDDGGADEESEDLESVLDQAMGAGLHHHRLTGHYRSRHESLIAFSNSKYYENQLITYPACNTRQSAVFFHRVNGAYAKGKGRNNPIEARAVVAAAVAHLSDPERNGLTLGIVTLNSEQQRTIEDLLDDARRRQPALEKFFHAAADYAPVFVKNLEAVQGDERDLVFFSLGYGPTEPGGKAMSMNFGPLNREGGERRLNVAVTRATTEVHVYASFDSGMLDLSRTRATAVEHLKHYLEFAARGPQALAQQAVARHGVDQYDSDFEKAAAYDLRAKGWRVQTQVGVSRFRVDLGVIHPHRPGVYLAGVECDGAAYHSSPSARDRDRIRHAVLENMGWRLIRLWSTDYFNDGARAIERIDEALGEMLAQDQAAGGGAAPAAAAPGEAEGGGASGEAEELRTRAGDAPGAGRQQAPDADSDEKI